MLKPMERENLASGAEPDEAALRKRLHYMAYNGMHREVFLQHLRWRPDDTGWMNDDIHVASSIIIGGSLILDPTLEMGHARIESMEFGFRSIPELLHGDSGGLDQLLEKRVAGFVGRCRELRRSPCELFFALEAWANYLAHCERRQDQIDCLSGAFQLGIGKHPGIAFHFTVLLAYSLLDVGEAKRALELLLPYTQRPYRAPSNSDLDAALQAAARAALAVPDLARFKSTAWSLMQSFSKDIELKADIAVKMKRLYRGWLGLLSARGSGSLFAKLIASLALLARISGRSRLTRSLGKPMRFGAIALLYQHRYLRTNLIAQLSRPESGPYVDAGRSSRRKHILITRAMGGVGDLLMMTPGISALKARMPDSEIHFAAPREFSFLFKGNDDVVIMDIDKDVFDPRNYAAWYNLSDCPASRVESRTAPDVKKNRIEIFAAAMGISSRKLNRVGRRPRYFISAEEEAFAQDFLARSGLERKVMIAIHPFSADTYRDYPHFERLAELLAQDYTVMVFHNVVIDGFNSPNIIKVDRYSLRQVAALLRLCRILVAPDSSLLHLAAALGVPGVALFGPTDGRLRTGDYDGIDYVDVRDTMRCVPCWRHEYSNCRVSGQRDSICMRSIDVLHVYQKVLAKLSACAQTPQDFSETDPSCQNKTLTKASGSC